MWEIVLMILIIVVAFGGVVTMVWFFLSLVNTLIKKEAAEKELQKYKNEI